LLPARAPINALRNEVAPQNEGGGVKRRDFVGVARAYIANVSIPKYGKIASLRCTYYEVSARDIFET
jgi:hypothetical protein